MSLGLNDLNKKRHVEKTRGKTSATDKPTTAGNVKSGSGPSRKSSPYRTAVEAAPVKGRFKSSKTARPWTSEELEDRKAKAKNRRPPQAADAVMNEDWLRLQAAPLFWMDVCKNSRLKKTQDLLVRIETRAQSVIKLPLRILRTLSSLRGKPSDRTSDDQISDHQMSDQK